MKEPSTGASGVSLGGGDSAGGRGFAAATDEEATRAGDWRRGREREAEASEKSVRRRQRRNKAHAPEDKGSQVFPPLRHKVHEE